MYLIFFFVENPSVSLVALASLTASLAKAVCVLPQHTFYRLSFGRVSKGGGGMLIAAEDEASDLYVEGRLTLTR